MEILDKIKRCTECIQHLPFAPRPIIQYSSSANVLIIGQAPGIKAHDSAKPWNDASGHRLRSWLQIDEQHFYNPQLLSIVPMGFCYPGKSKSGDLPPRPECAPKWHAELLRGAESKLILLIGKHAQDYYLADNKSLTDRLLNWRDYQPKYLLLPHPSPRNNIWLKKQPWFELEVLPQMQKILREYLT
ncbi:uracil-DNA glycosylase family protein [Paraglaciecola aquimarina]|uniref:Uracil-DNA glycosylase family protein n=1 Tax=Paraglaciecola aquimarina TaxID=1235557 RepID=A0ABU3ST84_9ALTE|nr:uracil-DNA glycosylase family protein [Paraglaciecola aquimarina]MDU0353205.1 uracil-DNA glycosylase family protein [Paraglaciecola aquimarina]